MPIFDFYDNRIESDNSKVRALSEEHPIRSFLMGNNMNIWTIILVFGALICGAKLIERLAVDHTRARDALKHLGPRTDTRYMTRAELFISSRVFLVWGILVSVVWIAAVYLVDLMDKKDILEHPAAMGLNFALLLLSGCGYLSAFWLLVRGLFRRADYDPATVHQKDMEAHE